MSDLHLGKVRESNGFMRSIATVVLVTYFSLVVSPGVQAMQQAGMQQASQEFAASEERHNLGKALGHAKQHLRVLADFPDALSRKPSREERTAAKRALQTWKDEKRALIDEVRLEFESTGRMLEAKNLPEVIRQRHAEAFATFEREVSDFNQDLDAALATDDEAVEKSRAQRAMERLEKRGLGRSQQHFDPSNLPNSTLKPDRSRMPKTTPEQFQAAMLLSEPRAQFAQENGFDFSQLPGAENPSYLAGTTEVLLSPDIVAKAADLQHSPVEIYNWVRNNVHWQPTWGAIQDASHTLSSQRGNAFDIASLTIALLRASGIPARYVHGTIDVPEDKFRNWAGGFEHIEAALDFASSGGIPVTALSSGGHVTRVRMEHIWVEAAVDFVPSRGVKNRSADSWVAMDPSFKQLRMLEGIAVSQVSNIDGAQLTNDFLASGALNGTQGTGVSFDAAILQSAQQQARRDLQEHLKNNRPGATVGEVLGGEMILEHSAVGFAASLPNQVVAVGTRHAAIPTVLQQQITFGFGSDVLGDPTNQRELPWASVNNKQLTLSFRAASQADEQTLRALLPDGGVTSLDQLPASVPAHLIRVIPELKVAGNIVLTGAAVTMGTEVTFTFNPKFVTAGRRAFTYKVPAGSYLAIAAFAGSLSGREVRSAGARVADTTAAITSGDAARVAALKRERLLGDTFYSGLMAYYSQYLALSKIAGLQQGGHHTLAAGLGSFGYEPNVDYFFGIPRRISNGHAVFNIPIVNVVAHDSSDPVLKRAFTMQLGAVSSVLEHVVPEQLFGTGMGREGVSAVKALTKANASGQTLVQITRANQQTAIPLLRHDSATLSEIQLAVAAGKTVVAHTSPISVPRWIGAGYIILDPETGAGAWKISGGANGGSYGDGSPLLGATAGILLASGGSEGDDSSILDSIFETLRTILLEVLLEAAKKVLLSIVSVIVDLFVNLLTLWESCSGLDFFWSSLLIGTLTLGSFLVLGLFPFLWALAIGLIIGYLMSQVVEAAAALCTPKEDE